MGGGAYLEDCLQVRVDPLHSRREGALQRLQQDTGEGGAVTMTAHLHLLSSLPNPPVPALQLLQGRSAFSLEDVQAGKEGPGAGGGSDGVCVLVEPS